MENVETWTNDIFNNPDTNPDVKIVEKDTGKFVLVHKFHLLRNEYFSVLFSTSVGKENKTEVEVENLDTVIPMLRYLYHGNEILLAREIRDQLKSHKCTIEDIISVSLEYLDRVSTRECVKIITKDTSEPFSELHPIYWSAIKTNFSGSKVYREMFCEKYASFENLDKFHDEWSSWKFLKVLDPEHQHYLFPKIKQKSISRVLDMWRRKNSKFNELSFSEQMKLVVDFPKMWEHVFTNGEAVETKINTHYNFLVDLHNSKGQNVFEESYLHAVKYFNASVISYDPFVVSILERLGNANLILRGYKYVGLSFNHHGSEPIHIGSRIAMVSFYSSDKYTPKFNMFTVHHIEMLKGGVIYKTDKAIRNNDVVWYVYTDDKMIASPHCQYYNVVDPPEIRRSSTAGE